MMRKILHERRCYFFEVVFFFFPVDDAFFVGDFFCFVVSSFFTPNAFGFCSRIIPRRSARVSPGIASASIFFFWNVSL